MNKAELITVISDRVGVTKKQAEDMIEAYVNIVTETLHHCRIRYLYVQAKSWANWC